MKRTDLMRHLQAHGWVLAREKGKHDVYCNAQRDRFSAVPRHREINTFTARNICTDLGIPIPTKR